MRRNLVLICLLIATLSVRSQIQFTTGDTVVYSGVTDANYTISVNGSIRNNSNATKTVAWELIDSFGQPMWQYTGFCDPNLCYNFFLNRPVSFQLAAHDSATLRLDLIAHCVSGKGNVTCHIWDKADSSNTSSKEVFAFDLSPNGSCTTAIFETKVPRINLYPNPARQSLNVDIDGNSAGRQLRIVDIWGAIVYSQPLSSSQIIDLSGLTCGLYIVGIYEGEKPIVVRKVLKE